MSIHLVSMRSHLFTNDSAIPPFTVHISEQYLPSYQHFYRDVFDNKYVMAENGTLRICVEKYFVKYVEFNCINRQDFFTECDHDIDESSDRKSGCDFPLNTVQNDVLVNILTENLSNIFLRYLCRYIIIQGGLTLLICIGFQ